MQGSQPPTAEEDRYLIDLKALWCIPCALDGWDAVPPTVHHVVEGRHRLGHMFAYPCCLWHHQARPPPRMTLDNATALYGPSLATEHKRYQEVYAPERELVKIAQTAVKTLRTYREVTMVFTAEQFGEHVRHEALIRFGRHVHSIPR